MNAADDPSTVDRIRHQVDAHTPDVSENTSRSDVLTLAAYMMMQGQADLCEKMLTEQWRPPDIRSYRDHLRREADHLWTATWGDDDQ